MQAIYTEASKEFYVHRSSWDVDPAMEYVATAYIIYEIDGEEYVFYSNNNYKNALGTTTAVNGRITKSVYQISKSVALQLSDAKANDMNFDAIGGAENIPQIGTATEESTITLLDVWRFVGDNKEFLKKWLDEGGTSR